MADSPTDNPVRYLGRGGVTCIDAIRSCLTPEEYRGFCKGTAMRYLWREKLKGGDVDLAKAGDYIDYALDDSEGGGR